jgi:ATP-dependent Clp protease ATP-binding subunit ClpA
MSVSGQEICRLAEAAAEASDPERALETLTELRSEVDEFERQQVARALTLGRSFGSIARAMGLSRQAVHRRFRELASNRRLAKTLPPSPEVRLVFEYARVEAAALGATVVGQDHVLLGILRNGDRRVASALIAAGVVLEDARRGAWSSSKPSKRGGRRVDIREVLAEALQCAKRRGAERIEVEHVLRAALAEDTGGAAQLLRRLGVPPARVLAELDEAPADGSCLEA